MALKCADRFHQAWNGLTERARSWPHLYDSPHYSGFDALIHSPLERGVPLLIYIVKPFGQKLPDPDSLEDT